MSFLYSGMKVHTHTIWVQMFITDTFLHPALDENECRYIFTSYFLNSHVHVFIISFVLSSQLVIILVLASLKRRTKFKLEWFDGRPGLLM